jgi:type I restriction enzyme M protein
LADCIQEIVNFIWPVADEILRDDFKRGKYPDIILPFTVLRRLDCVLASTKEKVLTRHKDLQKQEIKNTDGQLRKAAGHSFYNISKFDFPKLLDDAKNIGKNLIAYINGFSENMRDVIDNFGLRNNIDLLDQMVCTVKD